MVEVAPAAVAAISVTISVVSSEVGAVTPPEVATVAALLAVKPESVSAVVAVAPAAG